MAQNIKAAGLAGLRTMQANVSMRHDVFFHDVSQAVGGSLAFLGQAVKPFRQNLNDKCNGRKQKTDNQCQLPVQINQVAHECQQCQHIPGKSHDSVNQRRRAIEHFIHHRVGNSAGVLIFKQSQLCSQKLAKHSLAQLKQPVIGDFGQRKLG